ncbi:MAG: flagellar protein FlaG [Gallionella sp.]|nr:flagellar protein FlaG [Gallionella sp.]
MLIQNISNTSHIYEPTRSAGDGSPAIAANSTIHTAASQTVTDIKPTTDQKTSEFQLQSAVENTNKAMQASNKNLSFSVDTDTKQAVVKLTDSVTGDVIGQFPTEQMLAISKAVGLMQEQIQQASLSKAPVQSTQGLLIRQQA